MKIKVICTYTTHSGQGFVNKKALDELKVKIETLNDQIKDIQMFSSAHLGEKFPGYFGFTFKNQTLSEDIKLKIKNLLKLTALRKVYATW